MPPESDPGPAPDAGVPAPVPVAPAAPAAAAAVPVPQAEPDPFDTSADKFDRAYVTKIREEAKARRLELEPYENAFKPYNEGERKVWLDLAAQVANDPLAGAQRLADLAQALKEGWEAEHPPSAEPPAAEKPLTQKEMETFFASKQQELEINTASKQIEAQAKAWGYEPNSTEYKLLLTRAMDMNYDLEAAHKAEEASKQAIIDKFVAEKIASGEKWPITPAPGGVGAPSGEKQHDGSWDHAKNALRARLGAKVGT